MHLALGVPAGHLLMQDAGPGGHPLHIARAQRAGVAEAIAMLDGAFQHIGDGLDAAMGVPWKPLLVELRVIVAEIVKQQEGIKLAWVLKPKSAVQMHACALQCGLCGAFFQNGTQGHETSPDERVWLIDRGIGPWVKSAQTHRVCA